MLLTGIARLGADAELRHTPSGEQVTNLVLAWNYGKKDASGKQNSQWAELSLWGKRAESLVPHLKKGTAICITAEDAHIETYTKKDQTTGSKIVGRIIALEFAGGSQRSEQGAGNSASKPAQKSAPPGNFNDGFDDDIPF